MIVTKIDKIKKIITVSNNITYDALNTKTFYSIVEEIARKEVFAIYECANVAAYEIIYKDGSRLKIPYYIIKRGISDIVKFLLDQKEYSDNRFCDKFKDTINE